MKRKYVYIISSVFALTVLFFAVYLLNVGLKSKFDGEIKISLVDINGNLLDEKELKFKEGDSLPSLIEENFENFDFSDGYVKSIGPLTEYSNDLGLYYISFYVNDKYSEYGISMIKLEDGMKITFKMEEYLWEK